MKVYDKNGNVDERVREYLQTHIRLLPTKSTSSIERLKELANAGYRREQKIESLELSTYEGAAALEDSIIYDEDYDVKALLMENDIMRVYTDENSNQLSFESVLSYDREAGIIEYVLIDDARKYRVDFTVKIPVFKE